MHRHECFDNFSMYKLQATKSYLGVAVRLTRRLIADESGGEVLEYALIAGLLIVGSLAMIAKVGTKVLARWGSLNSSL
jgi:pilus assembly protein Flp/PilA